ncbi:MAG: nitrilase-related carbon-nitrogen hydrolase, partial [Planctomycetota bacterium]
TETPPLENKLVVIEPTGAVAWEFFKARPVPGGEASISVTTDGRLPSLDTPYGRLTSVICFDADFPQLLAQAGAMDADLVLDPSNDWQAIDPWHTQMASFRAIEQGFSLVRHTSGGLSAAYDHQGRTLAATDEYQAAENVLVAHVPTKGVRTVYSRLGDWFAWICLAAVAWSTFRAATAVRRRKISRPEAPFPV